jgi:hypothetical protein
VAVLKLTLNANDSPMPNENPSRSIAQLTHTSL